jgi:hypothetical protein
LAVVLGARIAGTMCQEIRFVQTLQRAGYFH